MKSNTSVRYEKCIKSSRWRDLRERVIRKQDGKCKGCGNFYNRDLQIHHLNYKRLGKELEGDVVGLCFSCHEIADFYRRVNRLANVSGLSHDEAEELLQEKERWK